MTSRSWTRHVSPEELGVESVIEKPFALDQLMAEMVRCLGRRPD